MSKTNFYKHESAYVDEGAVIGEGSKVWHFSHIMKDAAVGEKCTLGQNVHVASNVKIGSGVKIQNNVSIYEGVEIDDDVFLGPSCVFTNVINPRSQINRKNAYKKTVIKKGATIGANATIVCGITIGAYAFIAAGSVVTRDVPDYALIKGVPGVQSGWMSHYGHRLDFTSKDKQVCPESGFIYLLDNNNVSCLSLDEIKKFPADL